MKHRRVKIPRSLYVCNVFEDAVRLGRGVNTDSPAASSKVLGLCRAALTAGGNPWVISLGRGRTKGTGARHRGRAMKSGGIPILYLVFWDIPLLTHVVSVLSLCIVLWRMRHRSSHVIWYNYGAHYVVALLLSRVLRLRCILDLEDGYRDDDFSFRNRLNGLLLKLHVLLCTGGVMLACRQLAHQAGGRTAYVCYGVVASGGGEKQWAEAPLQVLLGGSLMMDTGCEVFLKALHILSRDSPHTLSRLRFVVTGFGECASSLERAATTEFKESLRFLGRVTDREYARVVEASHVGLCLKLPSSQMGVTTFPSKVIQLAGKGLLLVSTRVSDVPLVFDSHSAMLLDRPTPEALAQAFISIAHSPQQARIIALAGRRRVMSLLSERRVGTDLLRFWTGDLGEADKTSSSEWFCG